MLNTDLKQQLRRLLELMEGNVEFVTSLGSDDRSKELKDLLTEITDMSPRLSLSEESSKHTPSLPVNRPGEETGMIFAGILLGHEFNSPILVILQVSGRAPKEKQSIIDQIRKLEGSLHFETFISLTCQECPGVVQALNLMSVISPNITYSMIGGAVFREESEDVMTVPAIFLNDEEFGDGRTTIQDTLSKLGSMADASEFRNKEPYDILVVDGGPAGSSAAIYTTRKGLRTGIVADRIGDQVNDTASTENFIAVKETTGSGFSPNLAAHIDQYDIDTMTGIRAADIEKTDEAIKVTLENGAVLKSRTVIAATDAGWRRLNVPGKKQLINRGVTFCLHCDGPLFESKNIAVIGGGNSGVEAAIDLAGIVNHVALFEFASELKTGNVLRDRLRSLPNVDTKTDAKVTEVVGGDHVTGIRYEDISTGKEHLFNLDGIFVQIGLFPNTSWLNDAVELNKRGETVIDRNNSTSVPGIFVAGDVTGQRDRQIIISMGAGANVALSALDYIIRN